MTSQRRPDAINEYFNMTGDLVHKSLLRAGNGDEDFANEATLEYAKAYIKVEEHEEISRIQREEPQRFLNIVGRIAAQHPEELKAAFDLAREVYTSSPESEI